MKVLIDNWARVLKSELTSDQLETLRKTLTVLPRKVGDHPGEDPSPIHLYSETATTFGLPRQYFLARRKPHHEVEYRTNEGNKTNWPGDMSFSGQLREEQERARQFVVSSFKAGCLGGIVQAVPGWGKCTSADNSYLTDLESGVRLPMREFIGKTPLVPSLENGQIVPKRASVVWYSGKKRSFKVTLESGHWLEASFDHPVLTPSGYKKLEDLEIGDMVACSRFSPRPINETKLSDSEVATAALLIADGCPTHGHHLYVKGNESIVKFFEDNVSRVVGFSGFGVKKFENGAWYVSFLGLNKWMDDLGINVTSKTKSIPPSFFGLPDRQISILLRCLFTDGNVYTGKPSKIELTLASERLIDDVQELLKRFEIFSRKTHRTVTVKGKEYDAWRLQIDDVDNQLLFLNGVGYPIGSESKCEQLRTQVEARTGGTNWDVVPLTSDEMHQIEKETGSKWKRGKTSIYRSGTVGRKLFISECNRIGYDGDLASRASNHFSWDRVLSKVDVGEIDVVDLTVPESHNAVVNGLVIHNTVFACSVIASLQVPVLVVVHKEFLLDQWMERLSTFIDGVKIGRIQGDICDYKDKHVAIGMVHSLSQKEYDKDLINWPGLILTDECHRIGAATWASVPSRFPARWQLGLSATPKRKDGAEDVFRYLIGDVMYTSKEIRMKPKIRRVWIAPDVFKLVHTPKFNPSLIKKIMLLRFMCASKSRNKVIVDQLILALKAGRKCLVLSERLQHLSDMEAMFIGEWKDSDGPRPTAGYYIGGQSKEELKVASQARVVFATSQLVQEGLDIPPLDTIFLTTPLSDVEQAVGRILRPSEGKKDPVVVDFREDHITISAKCAKYRDAFYRKAEWET